MTWLLACDMHILVVQVRTAFNMLGPLLNPAEAAYGLVGVYSTDISELMAGALMVSAMAVLARM